MRRKRKIVTFLTKSNARLFRSEMDDVNRVLDNQKSVTTICTVVDSSNKLLMMSKATSSSIHLYPHLKLRSPLSRIAQKSHLIEFE